MTEKKLQEVREAFNLCRQMMSMDIFFCIYDLDTTILYMYPEDGEKDGLYLGMKFEDKTGGLQKVLATGNAIHNYIPLDSFGFAMEGNVFPVFEDGEIVGAASTAYIPINQNKIASQEWALQTVYSQILSVDVDNNVYSTIFSDYVKDYLVQDTLHYDSFCERTAERVHPECREQYIDFTNAERLKNALNDNSVISLDIRILDKNDEYRWYELLIKKVSNAYSTEMDNFFLYMVRDIHETKSREMAILEENRKLIEQLRESNAALFEQSMRDGLTGLYNRKGMQHFSQFMINRVKERNLLFYSMVADLNGLKTINDKYGHEEGDKAIVAIADLLKKSALDTSLVIRSGGDEFIIIDAFEEGSDKPVIIEENFKRNLMEYNESSVSLYKLQASYGWSFQRVNSLADIENVSNVADGEMYRMKNRYYATRKSERRE